jgi:hypothetical protein
MHGNMSIVGMVFLLVLPVVCPTAAADEMTEIQEQQFKLILPGQWTGAFDEKLNGWIYHSGDGRDTISVEIFRRSRGMGMSQMRKDMNDFVQTRRAAAQKAFGPGATVSSPEIKEHAGGLLARFLSNDSAQRHRGYTQIVVNKAVVGCFYYESVGLGAREFSKTASAALAEIGLAAK